MKEIKEEKKFNKAKEAKRGKDRKFNREKESIIKGKDDKIPVYRQGKNDPSWRTNDSVLTKLAANLPFGLPAGIPESITGVNVVTPSAIGTFKQPGIMNIEVLLTGGDSSDYNSPLNLCFRRIYSFVRHANSGSKNYEAADMGIYFMSIAQILGLLGWCQRTLRLVNEYSLTNRYTPRMLLAASWVDFDDLLSHQADLKYLISWLGKAVGSLAFPDMPYFKACYEAFKYVYKDNESPKEQFYMLHPRMFARYNPTYNANGGGLDYTTGLFPWGRYSGSLMSFGQIRDYILERMNILLGDEDCGIISGDILKAFQGKGLFIPEAFSLDYEVTLHSPEFLQQVHNLTCIDENYYNVVGYKQNPGSANTAPYIEIDTTNPGTGFVNPIYLCGHTVIDAFSAQPEPEEVVNCLVLNPQAEVISAGAGAGFNYDRSRIAFDLFLPVCCYIYDDISSPTSTIDITSHCLKAQAELAAATTAVPAIAKMSNFDWCPQSWHLDNAGQFYPISDLQNARIFDFSVGKRIHENSMLNLLNFADLNFYSK